MSEGKTIVISDGAAELFDKCRKIIGAVNGTPPQPDNTETMIVICTRFLQTAGWDWRDR